MYIWASVVITTQKNKEHGLKQTDRQTEGERQEKNRESKQGEMERSTSIIRMIIMAVVMATFSHPSLPPLPSLLLFHSQINSNALKCHSRHSKNTASVDYSETAQHTTRETEKKHNKKDQTRVLRAISCC